MLVLIVLTCFVAVSLATYAILQLVTGQQRAIATRLDRYLPSSVVREDENNQRQSRPNDYQLLARIGKLFAKLNVAANIEIQLQRAGVPLKGVEFLGLQAFLTVIGGFGLLFFTQQFFALVIGALLGILLPKIWLSRRQRQRLNAFNDQIVDALTMMSSSLKAGYSFLQAMEMVANEMPPPIAEEFGRTLRDMSLGVSTELSLEGMGRRVATDDLDLVLTAVMIQRQVGGNLAEILDNIAFTVRERIRLKGEIRTLTAQGRISGLIISMLPVAIGLFISVVNPGYLNLLFVHPLGQIMLALGFTSEVIGYLLIRKIVNIKV